MTERANFPGEDENPDLVAYIARDGAELGAFWRDEIEARARQGELLPNDYYWQHGMENWILLDEVIGPKPWQPEAAKQEPLKREAAAWRLPEVFQKFALKISPARKAKLILAGAICAAFLLATLIAIFALTRHQAPPVRPKSVGSRGFDVNNPEQREAAIEALREKIDQLPARAVPPLNIFYYDVSLETRRSPSPEAPLEALIRGSENTVDPQTQETIRRTEFQLIAAYRNGEWSFAHYKGMSRDLATQNETEEEHDTQTVAPPVVVTLLGLKIVPVPSDREK